MGVGWDGWCESEGLGGGGGQGAGKAFNTKCGIKKTKSLSALSREVVIL